MIEISNTTKYRINRRQIITLCDSFLHKFKNIKADVSIAIVGEKKIRELNKKYRGYDKPTDVLSFNCAEWEGVLLGEVIINPHEVKKISKYKEVLHSIGLEYPPKNPKKTETYLFYFLLVHGLLHLAGYDDEKEADHKEMLNLGKEFLSNHGIM